MCQNFPLFFLGKSQVFMSRDPESFGLCVQSWAWLWWRDVRGREVGFSLSMGRSKAKLYLTTNSLGLLVDLSATR